MVGPVRQPVRWLLFVAVPAVLGFAVVRGMEAARAHALLAETTQTPSPEAMPLPDAPSPPAATAAPGIAAVTAATPARGPESASLLCEKQEPQEPTTAPETEAATLSSGASTLEASAVLGQSSPPASSMAVATALAPVAWAPAPLPASPVASAVSAAVPAVSTSARAPAPEPALRPPQQVQLPETLAGLQPALPDCEPTPLTSFQLAEVLREGHIRHFGRAPHADRWACAWAHCAFEQDRGDAIYGNNLGHLTFSIPPNVPKPRPPGRVCVRRMSERLMKGPDRWARVDMWFRVFETPQEGAEAYWRLLANSYYSVLARCDVADPRGAAQRLAEIGYFTGPEAPYIEGMARLFVKARGSLIPQVMEQSPLP